MFCLIHRWKIDNALDEGQQPDARTQSHMEHCGECRRHHQSQQSLVSLLEQPTQTPESPAFLRSRIMNTIRATETEPVKPVFTLPVWVPVAACAVLVFFLIPRTSQNPSLSPEPNENTTAKTIPADFSAMPVELAKIDVNIALKQANKTISSPYDEEVQKLQKDLKSVGKMLGGLPLMHLASSQ